VTARYLLPCDCGRKVPVASRQAGQTVVCACGAALEVPTLLRLTALEREAPAVAPQPTTASWGIRQAITMIGLAILLASLAGAIALLVGRPTLKTVTAHDEQQYRDEAEKMSPAELYWRWKAMREQGLDPRDTAEVDRYDEKLLRYRLWWLAVLLGAVAGIAAIVVPLVRARRSSPTRAAKPTLPGK